LFSAIGFSTCISTGQEQFETEAALATGERVREDFLHHSGLSLQAKHQMASLSGERGGH